MHLSTFVAVLYYFSAALSAPVDDPVIIAQDVAAEISRRPDIDSVDILAAAGLVKLAAWQAKYDKNNKCNIATAIKRREWSNLSPPQRKDYINAVLCLQHLPPKSSPAYAPGARSRFDDFVITHVNQTLTIHGTTNFLTWHRYYVWAYEKALRDECGYKGYQPYWNWGKYASDPIHSPIFDGSDTSLGGNGAYIEHPGVLLPAPVNNIIPPDQGGGCVTTGPFKNMSVNIGPLNPTIINVPPNPRPDGLGYNPRCLRRDVNRYAAAVTTSNYTFDLITKPRNTDLWWFQIDMQGELDIGKWGVHTGGHFTVGGDPGGDFFTSSGDPAFYLHHGMVDRVYWIWQLQDLNKRLDAVSGTITINNQPPSRNGTRDDIVELGLNAPGVKLGSLLNTMGGLGGKFCYIYV